MRKLKRELKITDDGSHTLYVPGLNEHYHSTHGAIQEALHVYLSAGFNYTNQNPVHILEVGFGTGLNCFLTFIEAEKQKRKVIYHSIELYPIEKEEIEHLNYEELLSYPKKEIFEKLHTSPWNQDCRLSESFTLHKLQGDLRNFDFSNRYHLVYFDAFAPDVQPDLWTQDIFENIHQHLQDNAILTTYCTKGIVKKALRAAGFTIKRLPGPPGKRQMLRATKIPAI